MSKLNLEKLIPQEGSLLQGVLDLNQNEMSEAMNRQEPEVVFSEVENGINIEDEENKIKKENEEFKRKTKGKSNAPYQRKKNNTYRKNNGHGYNAKTKPVREKSLWLSEEERINLLSLVRISTQDDKNFITLGNVIDLDVELIAKTGKAVFINSRWIPVSQLVKVINKSSVELFVAGWFYKKEKSSFDAQFFLKS